MCAGVSPEVIRTVISGRAYKKQFIRHKEGCPGIRFQGIHFWLFIIGITGLLEQVADSAA